MKPGEFHVLRSATGRRQVQERLSLNQQNTRTRYGMVLREALQNGIVKGSTAWQRADLD